MPDLPRRIASLRARLLCALACALPCTAEAQTIPAFPGAEGAGAYAKGGRNGDVYHVTNTNPSGAGSLAYGLTTGVPSAGRTIVFDVSGYAHISVTLRVTASKITIAGQTAPGDGFGLKDGTFLVSGDDIVIRHLRFRNGNSADSINLDSGSLNSIFDHCDAMFSNDENMSSFKSPPENLTFQWSMNAWGLESHSCGGLWDQNHATSHHSLWAHNHTRNPKARPLLLDWVNNVTFDWDIGFILGDSETPANWNANVSGNYFISGTPKSVALEKGGLDRNGAVNFHVFLNPNTATSAPFHNLFDGNADHVLNGTNKGWGIVSGTVEHLTAGLVNTGIPVTQDDPLTAYKKIVSSVGPLRLDVDPAKPLRDEIAALLITELVAQTHHHVSSVAGTGLGNGGFGTLASSPAPLDTDRDGMPDFFEEALGFNKTLDDHTTPMPSSNGFITGTTFFPANTVAGYTRLEEYLHFLAIPHGTVAKRTATDGSSGDTFLDVDLRKFTKGFSGAPVFSILGTPAGGTASIRPDGFTARFVPTVNTPGRGKFDFKVVDGPSAWTQTCAVLVSNAGVPRELRWKGANPNHLWDNSTSNWRKNADDPALPGNLFFSAGDSALLDDNGSNATDISLTGALSPGAIAVNAGKNYGLSGAGSLSGAMALTKSGGGTLTINNTGASSFNGGTSLNEGTITLASTTANATGLGAGKVMLVGGTLNMFDNGQATTNHTTLPNDLEVVGTATIKTAQRGSLGGNGTGAGTLNLVVPWVRLDLSGNWSAFAGTLNVFGDADGGDFRVNNNATTWALARLNLGDKVWMYYASTGAAGGLTVPIGELNGPTTANLRGGPTSGRPTTFEIGGLNTDSTFLGTIAEQTGSVVNITKTGSGILTLGGTTSYTGATQVNAGALVVSGTLGNSPVTLAGGTILIGGGSIGSTTGGAVVANAGAIISPGTAPFTGATLTLGNALSLNGNTLYMDMSNSPTGVNDKIVLRGGTLAFSGSQYFQFLLLQQTLAAGTYDLITGAASTTGTPVFTHNLPVGTRQTFDLALVGSPPVVRLTVGGNPATLTWTGGTNASWNTTSNNWSGATAPNTFVANDAVVFDDNSAVNAVTISGSVAPRSVTFNNTTRAYSLGGTDQISAAMIGAGSLTKNNAGALTLTGTNTFTGGTTIGPGATITLANDDANIGGLGSGTISLNGGTLTMYSNLSSYTSATFDLYIPPGQTGTFNTDARCDLSGSVSGAGTLNLRIPWVRTAVFGDWSGFSGQLNITTDESAEPGDGARTLNGDFRIGRDYSWPGLPLASVNLGNRVWFYDIGNLNSGAGTAISIGELSGTSLSGLQGGAIGGRNFTYTIGAKTPAAIEVIFAGTISEQNSTTSTSFIKTGAGIWTLSGTCAWNGGTTVDQGTLRVSGSLTGGSTFEVLDGATLDLVNGSITTNDVQISTSGKLTGRGTLNGDVTNRGLIDCRTGGTLTITGDVVNSGMMRLANGTALVVSASGSLINNGTLDLLTGAQGLPANFVNNGIVIDSSSLSITSATKVGTTVTVNAHTIVGHMYQLQRASNLASGAWSDVGGPQAGTGGKLDFTDTAATGTQRFYRLNVTP